VIATARGADKAKQALTLGADAAVDAASEDFVERVKAFGGADVVLDMVGGAYAERDLDCMNPLGRLVMIATQAGAAASLDLSRIMRGRLVVTGSTLRPRSPDEKARLAVAVEARVWPWIEAGAVRPIIDRTFPLKEAGAAHRHLESGAHFGKVALTV
jgi:NADPH:quinone reductase-like Zn-dependent oxidoreductase